MPFANMLAHVNMGLSISGVKIPTIGKRTTCWPLAAIAAWLLPASDPLCANTFTSHWFVYCLLHFCCWINSWLLFVVCAPPLYSLCSNLSMVTEYCHQSVREQCTSKQLVGKTAFSESSFNLRHQYHLCGMGSFSRETSCVSHGLWGVGRWRS